MPKFYLTTPIYYVNDRPHIGHAYTTIVADTIARYKRMCGYDVVLLTGTDEHGQKMERSAKKAGIRPIELADRNSTAFRALWKELDLEVDRFIRTTEPKHELAVRRLLLKARDNGYIYTGHYEGQYCVHDEMYVDDPLEGNLCPECKRPTELVREENYYFKLSAFRDRLLEHYDKRPEFIQPDTRRNEVMAFVKGGLRDLSVSRATIRWGVPWPDDPKHVFYVWYDALTSYMSGIGFGDDELQWERYWPADLHLIGKEIIRFHAVYWPAFLMAAFEKDAGYPEKYLPKQMFAHGWWLFEQEKMSKSRGNIQLPEPVVRVLGVDALRYFLLREMVFGQDGNFSREALVTRYNADLANGLGNLTSRILTMIRQYFAGEVPDLAPGGYDPALGTACDAETSFVCDAYRRYDFSAALQHIWRLISQVDSYLTTERPWHLVKDPVNRQAVGAILYCAADALRIICALAHPVLPHATQEIWEQLGLPGKASDQRLDSGQLRRGQLQPGLRIGGSRSVFPWAEHQPTIERIEAMEQELRHGGTTAGGSQATPAATPAGAAAGAATKIGIEDFAKIEMRVGEVKSAERVPGADKLLKILVDIGSEVRQVVAGIAEVYKPEDLVGKKVVVVVNLQPRKLRGVESNGMIVAASVGPEGKPVLCTFTEEVPAGARLR